MEDTVLSETSQAQQDKEQTTSCGIWKSGFDRAKRRVVVVRLGRRDGDDKCLRFQLNII